jgi:hypothetical protein
MVCSVATTRRLLHRPRTGRVIAVGVTIADYPFNLQCGTGQAYQTRIAFWVYDATGRRSATKLVSLSC